MDQIEDVDLMTRAGDPVATGAPPGEAAPATVPPPVVTPSPAAPSARAAVNGEIRALAATFNLGPAWADGLIDRGAEVAEARSAALDALRTRATATPTPPIVSVGVSHDGPDAFVTRAAEALYARANPGHQLSEVARPYYGMTTVDIARESLRMAGYSTTGMAPSEIVRRSLHTTSDFATIFADVGNRTLRASYDAAPPVLRALARQSSARDFRAKTKVQAADLATLEKVNEAGEYKRSGFVEAKESYRIGTYGTVVGLSRQAIINDDLGAFSDMTGKLGVASAEFEAQFLVDLLTTASGVGPTMDDGHPLFYSAHGNVAGTGAALSVTTLSAARLAMRRQTGINGRPIAVAPKFLLVPPELETTADTVLAAITAATTANVNPFAGKLTPVVEPRLTNTGRWYVVADPASAEGLEYSYLQGAEGPQFDTRNGFDVDGVEFKVRLDFGAAFVDWRSWYTNAGG